MENAYLYLVIFDILFGNYSGVGSMMETPDAKQ